MRIAFFPIKWAFYIFWAIIGGALMFGAMIAGAVLMWRWVQLIWTTVRLQPWYSQLIVAAALSVAAFYGGRHYYREWKQRRRVQHPTRRE